MKNHRFTTADKTTIAVDLDDGSTVFVPTDPGNRDYQEILAANPPIADYVAPPPAPPQTISDRQFFHGLAKANLITQAEALAAVKTGAIPASLQALIDALPPEIDRFDAEMLVSGATEFEIANPFTDLIRQGYGWTQAQLEAFWTYASQL